MRMPAGTPARPVGRTVSRVTTKRRLGPDAQVDDKAMVITPDDPARTDPFLALSEDWFSEPGFEWHPHRGLETVTTVLDGVLEHGDNIGNSGALQPSDLQWMTAGRGIIHRELAFRNEHAHTLQLWLNLPARSKLTSTRYQDLLAADRPRVSLPGVVIDVISGTVAGVTGPAVNHWPVQAAIITLDPGASADYELPAVHRAFSYVMSGAVSVAGQIVAAGQTAWSDPAARQVGATRQAAAGRAAAAEPAEAGSLLRLAVPDRGEQGQVMIFSGQPIREPVAIGGPFVMSNRSEIAQAFADFQAGRFGAVPRQARLRYDR
jgi:quercetin 2,3-dioxygenase